MKRTFNLESEWSEYKGCFLELEEYAYGGTYIGVTSNEEGPICDLSVQLGYKSEQLYKSEIWIKDYDGMDTIAKNLEKAGIIHGCYDGFDKNGEPKIIKTEQGYDTYSLYELTPKALSYIPENKKNTELYKDFSKQVIETYKSRLEAVVEYFQYKNELEGKEPLSSADIERIAEAPIYLIEDIEKKTDFFKEDAKACYKDYDGNDKELLRNEKTIMKDEKYQEKLEKDMEAKEIEILDGYDKDEK